MQLRKRKQVRNSLEKEKLHKYKADQTDEDFFDKIDNLKCFFIN